MNNERDSVSQFYSNPQKDKDYVTCYRLDHSPRIQAMIDRYNLKENLKGKRLVDVGAGMGFAGELLDESTEYWAVDGAKIWDEERLCKGYWAEADLDYDHFADGTKWGYQGKTGLMGRQLQPEVFDAAFCLETLEHLSNPYHCLSQIKKLVKIDGDVFLSVPTESVTHNVVYPGLLWPPFNFKVFFEQMALPVVDFYIYQPKDRGWPAYQYRCVNRPWSEKKLVFPKAEKKFRDCTALEATNL